MRSVALRLLLCGSITYAAWWIAGPVGIVWCAPLFGAALARPIVDGIENAYGWLRGCVYRDVQGHHYAYKGISLSVAEDVDGHPWLRLSDVRKILPNLSRDELLQQQLGPSVQPVLPDRTLRIRADALVSHLGKTTQLETAKFALWVERNVVFPSRPWRRRGELASIPDE
ncbi:hypothetical protein AACH06_24770 [Ideonella sp. DXS29W]|uniref:Bro-N domain-containing protein n=1 Tax=Ideonella lacteola TaxID=2984193 RepID=A0ABU9BYX6_9BURK